VHASDWTERYAYDALGNVTESTTPDDEDTAGRRDHTGTLLRRAGRTTYDHDPQGRLVRATRSTLSGQIREWHYAWDADDRLTYARTPGGAVWQYRYDPLGRRIAKQRLDAQGNATEQTTFTWDGTRIAEQVHTSQGGRPETITWDYDPGTHRPVAQLQRGRPAAKSTFAATATQAEFDERFYAIVTDLVGTPTELLAADGRIAATRRATLWGSAGWDGEADCPLRFPGQYHDPETGLDYNYERYYDPETARYASADPLGLAPSPHHHGYVDNPLTGTDPLGLSPSGRNVVYRNLRPDEDPANGLTAKNPNATYTPAGHIVNGSRPGWASQYISTTRSLDVAMDPKWATGRVVAIDLDRYPGTVIDLSTAAGRQAWGVTGITAGRFANASQEVLLVGHVPSDALSWIVGGP
jgi:RHS repeat-associated protein